MSARCWAESLDVSAERAGYTAVQVKLSVLTDSSLGHRADIKS